MAEARTKALILNSEGCGTAEPELGYEILVKLLEALPRREDRPAAIVLWNSAVKLLAGDSPLIPHFKRLEEKGVTILAGKLCVSELGLEDNLSAGKVASMDEILDVLLHSDVISL
jgi:hypothetical protein